MDSIEYAQLNNLKHGLMLIGLDFLNIAVMIDVSEAK